MWDFIKFIVWVLLIFGLLFWGLLTLVSYERSHPCQYYVDNNFAIKNVPVRCLKELQ